MKGSRRLLTLGAPATRALAEAGVRDRDDLRRVDLAHLAALHGVGPAALRLLRPTFEEDVVRDE